MFRCKKNISIITVALSLFLCQSALGDGFANDYIARSGDANSDGFVDFYIYQDPNIILIHGDIVVPIVIPSPVVDFVLQQNGQGGFDIVSSLSQSQRNVYRQWPESNVELITGDLNLDGSIDVIVEKLGSAIIGMDNQIVFGPDSLNGSPTEVVAITQEMQKFFNELDASIYNANYFDQAAPIVNVNIPVTDTVFITEYCGLPGVNLADLEPLGTLAFDTTDDVYAENNIFISDCIADGYTVIHYDYVNVTYDIPVGTRDYRGFSRRAMIAGPIINDVLAGEEWGEGSVLRQTIEDILRTVFGTDIFGPNGEEVYEDGFDRMLRNFIYLAQLDQNDSDPDDPSGGLPCAGTPLGAIHSAGLAFQGSRFQGNFSLSDNISKTVSGSNYSMEVNVSVSSLGGSNVDNVIKGMEKWSSCRSNPDGDTFDLTVNATSGLINTDITIATQPGKDCRDRAQQGGTVIYPCIESDIDQIISAFHEFGHILGFGDAYTGSDIKEGGTQPIPGFNQDIMATLRGRVLPYHLQILSQRY